MELERRLIPVICYRKRKAKGERQSNRDWLHALQGGSHYPQVGYSNTFATLVRIDSDLLVAGKVCVKEFPDFCGGVIVHSGRVCLVNFRRGYDRWGSYIGSGDMADAEDIPMASEVWERGADVTTGEYIDAVKERVAQSLVAGVLTWLARQRRSFVVMAEKEGGNLSYLIPYLTTPSKVGELTSFSGGGLVCTSSHVAAPSDWNYGQPLGLSSKIIPPVKSVTAGDLLKNSNSGNDCHITTAWYDLDDAEDCYSDEEEWEMDHEDWYPDECPNCGGTNFEAEGGWEWSCLDDGCEHSWYEEPPDKPKPSVSQAWDKVWLSAFETEGCFEWLPTGDNWNG